MAGRLDRRDFLRIFAAGLVGTACTRAAPSPRASTTTTPLPTPTSRGDAIGRWRRIDAHGPSARRDHTFTHALGQTYVFGGRSGSEVLGDFWRYDGRSWERIEAPGAPSPRFGHNTVHIDGWLIVFGGQAGGTLFNDAYVFLTDEGSWERIETGPQRPGPRYGAGAIATGDRLIVSHGFNFDQRFDDTWDLRKGPLRWRDRSPGPDGDRPQRRCLHRCVLLGDEMLLVGGQADEQPYLDDSWLYDLSAQRWRRVGGRSPGARNLFALTSSGDRAWLFGGFGASGPLDDLWELHAGRWRRHATARGAAPSARGGIEGAYVDSDRPSILIFGGSDGRRELADLWELSLTS